MARGRPEQMEQIEVDGLEIAYRRKGEGPPIVLLHGGLGLDSREWRHQLRGLSDEFTVVAWDMPGCGGSDDPPEYFGTRDYADCLASFISLLGLERPTSSASRWGACSRSSCPAGIPTSRE